MRLLDTDILIDVLRGHPPAVDWFGDLSELPSVPGFVVMEFILGPLHQPLLYLVRRPRRGGRRRRVRRTPRRVGSSRYLLPLNIESRLWVDSDGEARIMLDKMFHLTPRLALRLETEYDTLEDWEVLGRVSYREPGLRPAGPMALRIRMGRRPGDPLLSSNLWRTPL